MVDTWGGGYNDGDIVEWDGSTWNIVVPNAAGFVPSGTRVVVIESGAGDAAGFLDDEYSAKGAKVVSGRAEVFQAADAIAQVRALGANPEQGRADLDLMRDGQAVIGMCEPLTEHDSTKAVAARGAVLFSMEMMPRITRAQSMDVLSSMATIAGYKAVLLAAMSYPRCSR